MLEKKCAMPSYASYIMFYPQKNPCLFGGDENIP